MSKAKINPKDMGRCPSDFHRAVICALAKETKRLDEAETSIEPGTQHDVGGISVTVTIPKGTIVKRGLGNNGDGTDQSKATQDLYGYDFWAILFRKLMTMNQWNMIRDLVIEAMEEKMRLDVERKKAKQQGDDPVSLMEYLKRTADGNGDWERQIESIDADVEKLKCRLPIPDRTQDTTRRIVRPESRKMAKVEWANN